MLKDLPVAPRRFWRKPPLTLDLTARHGPSNYIGEDICSSRLLLRAARTPACAAPKLIRPHMKASTLAEAAAVKKR